MVPSRLKLLSPNLDEIMHRQNVDARRQQHAALVACRMAVASSHVQEPVISKALLLLDANKRVEQALRDELQAALNRTDGAYFDVVERSGNANTAEAMSLFCKARAIASVLCATASEREQWSEAVYEAAFATDNPVEIINVTLKALS